MHIKQLNLQKESEDDEAIIPVKKKSKLLRFQTYVEKKQVDDISQNQAYQNMI